MPKHAIDPNDAARHSSDYYWYENAWFNLSRRIKRFWKTVVLRRAVCSWRGHYYDGTEWGHMLGSETHDEWCARCDKFRGIPCAEHPKYDTPRSF